MDAQIICQWFKFGYCKHKERCRKQHEEEVCSEDSCEIFRCRKRHPKTCKYFWNHGRCKFDPCAFLHRENTSTQEYFKMDNQILLVKCYTINETLKELEV